ncbi:type IX secretion system protein PorQ [Natronoflexus pectinivorans]|uniref:Type IX secretion system PorP/SprF family membrane protein n=1 Tax=Natronoflexus pectinivorans TaxID=682526 RepID=A0A4V6NMS3_9BACT|nr:type IX secretion system protein PorQ [Natronoflexus pectinivorans]TCO10611.1 hypothetical protein EV194_101241 [Natronoflexus pectinivorans]
MKKFRILLVLVFLAGTFNAHSQRGGESVFGLLNLTQSARIASLGGNQVGLHGHDLSILMHNPGMLDSTLSQQISMSYVPYMAGINYGFSGAAYSFEGIGNFAIGFHHVGYGSFVAADETGLITGSFSAGETVVQLTYSRQLSPQWSAGISIKPVFSRIESYNSWGIASDIGFFYRHRDGLLTGGAVLRNYGHQIASYSGGQTEPIASDLQFGIAQKLEHAPFRFSLTVQDLLGGTLQYSLRDQEEHGLVFGERGTGDNFVEKAARHLTVGVEFVPSDNFYVAAGMNPRRRQELKVESKTSTVGFSWGFGIRISKFNFSYGSARYHLSGTSNHFSITTNLTAF